MQISSECRIGAGTARLPSRSSCALCAFVFAVCWARAGAQEQPADYAPVAPFRSIEPYIDVRGSLTHTDNVFRDAAAKQDDTLAGIGTSLDLRRKGRKLALDARADLDYIEYLDDSYSGRVFGYFNGSAIWGASTDRFQWTTRDTFGQLLNDPLAVATPESLENINYFSTGPTLNLPLGKSAYVSFYGLFSDTEYEKSNFDSQAWLGGVALGRNLSPLSRISLNATTQRTSYDDETVSPDFDVREYFFRYDTEHARTTLALDVGYTQLHRPLRDDDGSLVRLEIGRRVAPTLSVFIRGSQEYTTAGESLRGTADAGGPVGSAFLLASAEPFRQRTYDVGLRYDGSRTHASVTASRIRDHYQQQLALGRSSTAVQALIARNLTPTLTATVEARRSSYSYDLIADYRESNYLADLTKRFHYLSVTLVYERYERTGDPGAALFDENRFGIRASYTLVGLR